MSPPTDPPSPPRVPVRDLDLGPAPLPLALELPAAMPRKPEQTGPARPAGRQKTGLARWLIRVGVVLAVLAAGLVALVVWVLPWYVKRQCVEAAAAHGITLAIDDVALGSDGFELLGVRATAAALPGAHAQAPQLDIVLAGLHPDRMTVHRAELTLAGSWTTVEAALAAWRASPQGGQGGAWTPATVVVDESRVVWPGAFAENGRVEASNVRLDVSWPGATATVHVRSDNVIVAMPQGKVGPWRVDVDRAPGTSRMRVALDPAVPDACTVLIVGDDARTTSVDVVVPRSPLARLGLPPTLLGLHGNALQVEANIHYGTQGLQRAEATTRGGIYGIEAGLPSALDVVWDAAASGAPRAGLDVKKAKLSAGPLTGAVTGTVKTFDDGFRVDLAWSGGPIACAAFDTPLGAGNPMDVAFQLRKLAEGVGLTKLTGDVRAHGTLVFDSRDLAAARAEFTPEVSCQVALFHP